MKNEEKKEKKPFPTQKPTKETKKPTRKSTNQIEKYNKNIKNMTNIKNNMSNIYKITTGTTLFSDNNKKEKNEAENSFEGKMFYEVNNLNKNSYNFNSPIKTINVYRNNFFNYTNNNILSNLLCDVSDDNKNVMVSELDLNISNSQAPTPRPENIPQPQKRLLEKQNTEIDFKSQLESNIIKILEKNLANNNSNNNKINMDKKPISQIITEENKDINVINLDKINININNKEENDNKIKNNFNEAKNKIKQNDSNKLISKVNSREIKNKYFVSSAKSRKSRGLKSPNINIHKVNSIISPTNKINGNKKIYLNNYTKTDICVKKYKTIIENNNTNSNYNNKNSNKNNQINSVKFYNQIKSKTKKNKIPTHNTTSKKAIKSYIIYNHNLANNKISYPNNNYRHFIYKLNEKNKSKNILLTNNSNNNLDININSNSIHQSEKMNYSKYKNILNELKKNLSKHLKKEENISKANSHRNKKNQTYLIFNLENNNGRKSIKKGEIFSSNTSNTISNKYNLNSQKNLKEINKIGDLNDINNNNDNESNKNIIMMNHSIIHNSNKILNKNNINCLTKQNSENNLLHNNDNDPKSIFYEKKRPNKNNSCQLNQKLEGILSDSFLNVKHKLSCEKNKFKYNNNLSLYGIEKINIEINQKSNNSNIEINPKDLLEATNKEKDKQKNYSNKTLNNSQIKKKNLDLINNNNIITKKSKKKNITNKKMNASNNKYKSHISNSKSNNINNMANNNMITFRNKFINNISIKKHLSNSKDNKEKENKEKQKYKKLNNKGNNNNKYFYNNFNLNYNYNHFSPVNRVKEKSNKKVIKEANKINIDINFNNNINYIYIIKTKKSRLKNKSNNHFCTMK